MRIVTTVKADPKYLDILNSCIGQMSDGIWENTRSMEKYWKSLRVTTVDGYIVIEDRNYVCADPVEFMANKIKQIIKIEIDDGAKLSWSRTCCGSPCYIHGHITVGDCYKLYELLKGRDTARHYYSTYDSYHVVLTNGSVTVEYDVTALNERQAKEVALRRLADSMTATVTAK
jgi:hypothetical protein